MASARLHRRRVLAMVLAASSVIAFAVPASASGESDEQRFVDLINSERRATGAGPLTVLPDLVDGARAQAQRMLEEERIFHNPDLGSVAEGWSLLGENVGRGGDVESLHDAFMASQGHRDNLLNSAYDAVGVGVVWDGSIPYVVQVFMDSVEDLRVQHTPPFSDDDDSVHEADIVALAEMGIVRGCAASRYCPDRDVTRGEMATMMVRAFGIPAGVENGFADDDGSVHESAIDSLAAAGITHGCEANSFCPDRSITRGEIAAFLTRVLELPDGASAGFQDTTGHVHSAAIDSLAAVDIARGCTITSFCPQDHVTRGQLASFLVRALAG